MKDRPSVAAELRLCPPVCGEATVERPPSNIDVLQAHAAAAQGTSAPSLLAHVLRPHWKFACEGSATAGAVQPTGSAGVKARAGEWELGSEKEGPAEGNAAG